MQSADPVVQTPAQQPNFLSADFFTEKQLAQELDVTTRTLRRWHNLRTGPPRTLIGPKIYYRKQSVFRWLVAREQEPLRRSRR